LSRVYSASGRVLDVSTSGTHCTGFTDAETKSGLFKTQTVTLFDLQNFSMKIY
jgi:hypothetical protein